MRITFKQGPHYSGRMRLANHVIVSVDGRAVARIQETRYENNANWFWYGDGVNTSGIPMTLEECKVAVKEHFKRKPTA